MKYRSVFRVDSTGFYFISLLGNLSLGRTHFAQTAPSLSHSWSDVCLLTVHNVCSTTRVTSGQGSPDGEATGHTYSFHLTLEDSSIRSKEEITTTQNDLGKNKHHQQNTLPCNMQKKPLSNMGPHQKQIGSLFSNAYVRGFSQTRQTKDEKG